MIRLRKFDGEQEKARVGLEIVLKIENAQFNFT